MEELVQILSSYGFSLNTEKQCQAQIEQALLSAGIVFKRECDLRPDGGKGIIDFLTESGIGIEVKIGGQNAAIY